MIRVGVPFSGRVFSKTVAHETWKAGDPSAFFGGDGSMRSTRFFFFRSPAFLNSFC
jgi:hypothetical protein